MWNSPRGFPRSKGYFSGQMTFPFPRVEPYACWLKANPPNPVPYSPLSQGGIFFFFFFFNKQQRNQANWFGMQKPGMGIGSGRVRVDRWTLVKVPAQRYLLTEGGDYCKIRESSPLPSTLYHHTNRAPVLAEWINNERATKCKL